MAPEALYQQLLAANNQKLLQLKSKRKYVGWLRIGNIAGIVAFLYLLSHLHWWYVVGGCVALLIIFARLVYLDATNSDAIAHTQHIITTQQDELKALQGQFFHFDNGAALLPPLHPYAQDIDIFGHASLYQFTNRTSSEMGSIALAQKLTSPLPKHAIVPNQKAIAELTNLHSFRHNLQALGKAATIKTATVLRLKNWMNAPAVLSQFKPWKLLRYLLPAIILCISVLTIYDVLSMNVFYSVLFVFAVIAYQVDKVVAPIHAQLGKMVDELKVVSSSLKVIEGQTFQSEILLQLHTTISGNAGNASSAIKRLEKLLNRLDIRYNIVLSAPLNLFLLWNLQQVLELEKWKKNNQQNIEIWFDTLGTFEALNSFATLQVNHPHWCVPSIAAEHFFISGTDIGHPLIHENKRVNNPIAITQKSAIMLVTGSNMAGKSTYLRSIGVNVVLAMAGAAVCAKTFKLSHVHLMTSMRIADNLEESTSTFYAELKKLQSIITEVNNGAPVFILLDEILRGTNSYDRHIGSVALLKQLIKKDAVAIVATHDVELAALQQTHQKQIENFHFDVQVANDELFFDYKLKEGICTSMNASILMKKIGIEM